MIEPGRTRWYVRIGKTSLIDASALIAVVALAVSAQGGSDAIAAPDAVRHQPLAAKDAQLADTARDTNLDLLKKSLDEIYARYRVLPKTVDNLEELYQLHLKVAALRDKAVKLGFPEKMYDEKYAELGLYIGHFTDTLDYSNKLLIEVHRLNPNSSHREESWYAAMREGAEYGGPGHMTPDVLKAYLKEFPEGKYASAIYFRLGNYYSGLYKYLRYGDDPNSPQDRESCYKDHHSRLPVSERLKRIQAAGVAAYRKALDLERNPTTRMQLRSDLRALSQGRNLEYDPWCDQDD